ncbi:MAG: glucose 1-dehydrogenase [Anaerolineae bacterium]|jgi:NAD(P)-dependent dehydrogenase (short-subunit alcohol dehydrogenase family)
MDPRGHFDLTGKVALITGASKGIGEAIALAFAEAGAKVVVSSRKQAALDAVAAKIEERGGEAMALAAHTGETDAINALVTRCVERFGGVDIAVNNAATNPHFGPLLTADEGQWQKILDVNVIGYFRVAKAVVPEMRKRGGGKIINLASIAGLRPMAAMGIYGVSKAAVLMLTQTLAQELGPHNIQVNAIAPGVIKTRFSSILWQTDSIARSIQAATPMGRFGEVGDLTAAALYLASPASDFMTGAVMLIDGGMNVAGTATIASTPSQGL